MEQAPVWPLIQTCLSNATWPQAEGTTAKFLFGRRSRAISPRVNPRRDDMSPGGASMYCSPHDVREVLQAFVRDQRQTLRVWKDDVNAQVKEHLGEKYPYQDMNIVAESFEIKMARSLSQSRF